MATRWTCGDLENWHVATASFVVWSQGHGGVSKSNHHHVRHKQTPVQLCELQVFIWHFTSTIFHFLVKHSADPSHTDFCYPQVFTQDHLNWISANAHGVSYLMYPDSMFWQSNIFCSSTVFFTDSFRWASGPSSAHLPGFRSASMKLSSPTFDHSM